MIYAGRLKEKLEFYKIQEVQTESGYKSSEEVYMFTANAERTKNKENFVVDAEEIFHSVFLTFRLRFRREVNETNIVKYKNERYRIISLNPWESDGEMTIILEKINE
jgi:head-tail adaptor